MVNEKEAFRDIYNVYLKYQTPEPDNAAFWKALLHDLQSVIDKHNKDELVRDLAATVYTHLERKSLGGVFDHSD